MSGDRAKKFTSNSGVEGADIHNAIFDRPYDHLRRHADGLHFDFRAPVKPWVFVAALSLNGLADWLQLATHLFHIPAPTQTKTRLL